MFDVLEAPTQTMTPAPDPVAPEDLVEELAAVLSHRDRIDARAGDLIRQIGETKAFGRDGYSSLTALLKHRMSLLRLRFSPCQMTPMTRRHPRPISTTDH